jgi:hypothetical protein
MKSHGLSATVDVRCEYNKNVHFHGPRDRTTEPYQEIQSPRYSTPTAAHQSGGRATRSERHGFYPRERLREGRTGAYGSDQVCPGRQTMEALDEGPRPATSRHSTDQEVILRATYRKKPLMVPRKGRD